MTLCCSVSLSMSPEVYDRLLARFAHVTHLIIDEVSQVKKLLLALVIVVIMIAKPNLNVIIGGDHHQLMSLLVVTVTYDC